MSALVAEETTYRSVEVVALAGCSYRTFDYWCRSGAFGPIGLGQGSGSRRHGFTGADVRLARALWRLSAAGLLGGGARMGGERRPMTRFVGPIRAAIEAGSRYANIPLGPFENGVTVAVLLDEV